MKKTFFAMLGASAISASLAVAQTTDKSLIDDFEDGDGVANTDDGTYNDVWFAYTDVNDKGASSYTNEKDANGDVVVFPEAAAGGSENGAGLKGVVLNKGENPYDPYVSLGLKVNGGLSGCTTISYDYMGSAHILEATIKGDEEGALSGYNRPKNAVEGSTTWSKASFSVSALKQEDWGADTKKVNLVMANVVQLDWKIKKEATADFLYIDNFTCTGYTGAAASNVNVDASKKELIDDFEDRNTNADALASDAYWYLYTVGTGSVSNVQDENETWDIVDSSDATNTFITMSNISGIAFGDTTYPSVGIGLNVPDGAFKSCTAIQYDYKGSAHKFRASLSTITEDQGFDHVTSDFASSAAWKTVTVSAADLSQPDWVADKSPSDVKAFNWATVSKLAWVVDEKIKTIGTELSIDNVYCIGSLATKQPKNGIVAAANVARGLNASLRGSTLNVTVAKAGLVKIQVFDMMGHMVDSHSQNMAAGTYAHSFASMSKGSYVIRVQQGSSHKDIQMRIR